MIDNKMLGTPTVMPEDMRSIMLCTSCNEAIPYISLASEDATITIECKCLPAPITLKLSKYLQSLQYKELQTHKDDAKGFCTICHQWLCIDCLNNHYIDHHPITPIELRLSCPEHQTILQWYCNDCDISICKHCTKIHQTHHKEDIRTSLLQAFNEQAALIDLHLKNNEKIVESYNDLIDQSAYSQNFTQIKQEIQRAYQSNLNVNLVLKDYCALLSKTGEFIGAYPNYNFLRTLKAIQFTKAIDIPTLINKNSQLAIEENYARIMKYFLNEFIISLSKPEDSEKPKPLIKKQHSYNSLKCIITIKGLDSCVYSLIQLHNENLASCGRDNVIKIWSIDTSECLKTLKGHKERINSIIQLADMRIASGSNDTTIKFWPLQSRSVMGKIFKSFKAQYEESITVCHPVTYLLQLTDGLLACGDHKGMIRLFNITTYKCFGAMDGHTNAIRSIIQLRDERIVSAGDDKEIIVWNERNSESLEELQGHLKTVRSLVELEDGRLASASDDYTVRLWDLAKMKMIRIVKGHADCVRTVIQLRDGRVVTCGNDQTIRLWDVETMECISIVDKHSVSVNGVRQLNDGTIVSWDGEENSRGKDVSIKIWIF